MENVTGIIHLKDRWRYTIIKQESNQTVEYTDIDYNTYVMGRNASLQSKNFSIQNSNFCCLVNSSFKVECGENSTAVIVKFPGLYCFENLLYVENNLQIGNLTYMDGGTNSNAITPSRLGDPVINYVHFPKGMYQTLHTHPSHRIGLILKGNGKIELDNKEMFDVREGGVFLMARNELHNFICTDKDVVAFVFAPESGDGPTDEVNPLQARTILGRTR